MKLLQKSDIAVAKARDASREVSEGLKLTRRVDALRELRLSEEKKLEDWRRETLETIQAEITSLNSKKEALQSQISTLESKIAELSPKMATERHALIELDKELTKWQKDLENRASLMLEKEQLAAKALKKAESSVKKSVQYEVKTAELESLAEKKYLNAEVTRQKAQKIHDEAVQERNDIERSLSLRENAIILREKLAKEMELNNMKALQANETEQKRLEDVAAMLQRDSVRIKKAHGISR